MSKKIRVLCTMLVITMFACSFALVGCIDPPEREVIFELLNPITGEPIKDGETIDFPDEPTRAEVRIKDKITGAYLTDDDLPGIAIENSIDIGFEVSFSSGGSTGLGHRWWPEETEIEWDHVSYKAAIRFSCMPQNLKNPEKFKRKYKDTTEYIRFYVNKK